MNLILDVDGVLVDNREFDSAIMRGIVECLTRTRRISTSDARNRIEQHLHMVRETPKWYDWSHLSRSFGLGELWWALHHKHRGLIRPLTGVREAMQHLADLGFSLFVASDATRAVVNLKLASIGIERFFQGTYSQSELGSVKSSRTFFIRLLGDMGVDAPTCLFVDNRPKNLQWPMRLGFQTVWFRQREHAQSEEELRTEPPCCFAVDSLGELTGRLSDSIERGPSRK